MGQIQHLQWRMMRPPCPSMHYSAKWIMQAATMAGQPPDKVRILKMQKILLAESTYLRKIERRNDEKATGEIGRLNTLMKIVPVKVTMPFIVALQHRKAL